MKELEGVNENGSTGKRQREGKRGTEE